ncbi:hypothetical protein ACTXT7_010391 [Hymenolepis weldensis]
MTDQPFKGKHKFGQYTGSYVPPAQIVSRQKITRNTSVLENYTPTLLLTKLTRNISSHKPISSEEVKSQSTNKPSTY